MEPGKPDAVKPPVRFDEGQESDGHWSKPFNPSAPAYSTHFGIFLLILIRVLVPRHHVSGAPGATTGGSLAQPQSFADPIQTHVRLLLNQRRQNSLPPIPLLRITLLCGSLRNAQVPAPEVAQLAALHDP